MDLRVVGPGPSEPFLWASGLDQALRNILNYLRHS